MHLKLLKLDVQMMFKVLFVTLLFIKGTLGVAAQSSSLLSYSPTHRFTVQIEALEHVTYTKEEQIESIFNVNHVKYKISFINKNGKKVAESSYVDVYGFQQGATPANPLEVITWIRWSPNDDMAILPAEGWASAPGTESQDVINLNPEFSWQKSIIKMDLKLWANAYTAIGDSHEDCDYNVLKFDVKTGESQVLRKNIHVYGYEILKVNKDSFITKAVLNNCMSDEDVEHYYPYCERWNLTTLHSKDITCPDVTHKP
jgi:hypothetical protein